MLRPGHPLFAKPFAVTPVLEETKSPDNFAKWQPGFPATLPTFAIFTPSGDQKPEPGLVTGDGGFEEFPDAERILGGINMKGPGYAAIARHGSFVMWGFHCLPTEFTDVGRRLYLNSIAYAAAHKGRPVETLRLRPVRGDLDAALSIFLGLYPEDQRMQMLQRHYGGEAIPEALLTDVDARKAWLAARRPFLHPAADGSDWQTAYQLAVDADCQALGVANDSFAFLDAIAARLTKDAHDALAATLLARYAPDTDPAGFAAWLAENRERLYFTEAGGWVWRSAGRPAASAALSPIDPGAAEARDELVRVTAEVTDTKVIVRLRIASGWHVSTPKAEGAAPVTIEVLPESAFTSDGPADYGEPDEATLSGYAEIKLPIRRVAAGDALRIRVTYTACDAATCRPPRTVELGR